MKVPSIGAVLLGVATILVSVALAGCGVSSPSTNRTDTFSNVSLGVGGYNSHGFTSNGAGEFDVNVTSVSPDATAVLGLLFGQLSGSTCIQINGYQALARANNPINPLSGSIQKGNFCIAVYDAGFLTRAQTYTVTVSHP
jgi:hypothetical protein